ncbi:nuclear pore complex assembly-domain-containing protein [Truncatella angustata]|uniref:Nuclear pore complex assembly-domain-containing protein n=1 Tax=Truncatella angustata TaxID=152316 RepID=A0A9P8UJ36_9PEZI|nr:nuclear pore complex assembly-domain-containing protein [Truncatella angustata]KAH6653111.1 nuclear pore complex assembly-domain-containing protein [Truncatella angustata]
MLDYTNFERVFGLLSPYPYNRTFIQEAESYRRSFEGALFIDNILAALGLSKARSLYPPKSESALQQLHQQIAASTNIATHHKLSILYYLLLDVDDLAPSRTSRTTVPKADQFANRSGLPSKYQLLIQGLWYFDRQSFPMGLEYLTHPSLTPEFADDIITILAQQATKDGDYTLPLSYWHTVQPVLKTEKAVELLFEALVRSDVGEALRFSRTKPDAHREGLFRRLIVGVLDGSRDEDSAERAGELASLPFQEQEEEWFRDCLSSSEGKRLRVSKDTLLMRRIALGEPVSIAGEKGTWGVVMEAFKVGSGGRA